MLNYMEIRLVTSTEEFEKVFSQFFCHNSHLSFYEFTLRHELSFNQKHNHHLIVASLPNVESYLGVLSYTIDPRHVLGKILSIKEIHTSKHAAYSASHIRSELLNFIEKIAIENNCDLVKMQYKNFERNNFSIFDKVESFLKNLL